MLFDFLLFEKDPEMLTTFNDNPNLLKKVDWLVTDHGCMAMTLKTKAQSSQWKSQDRKKHVKFGQMWRFCSLFSSIAKAWCIMNSCYKVVRSIRNTTLKLWADLLKQFIRNAQNCGITNHGFCTMITHQLTHWCLCVSFRSERNHALTPVFIGLGPHWLFWFPKTEDAAERKVLLRLRR